MYINMVANSDASPVFISYAWGEGIAKKEWLRSSIVSHLNLMGIPVFWDRDVILPGEKGNDVLAAALSARPVTVLCICDLDYLKAAQRINSGLAYELKLLSKIADTEGVRIVPIVVEDNCAEKLPEPLTGRWYVNASDLYREEHPLGPVVLRILEGANQTQLATCLTNLMAVHSLQKKAQAYAVKHPIRIEGTSKQGVFANDQLLVPPDWMVNSTKWSSRMMEDELENEPRFSPKKGIWTWSCKRGASHGMWALGTAIMSAWFPRRESSEDLAAITSGGLAIAEGIISFCHTHDVLITDEQELLRVLFDAEHSVGINALHRLLT